MSEEKFLTRILLLIWSKTDINLSKPVVNVDLYVWNLHRKLPGTYTKSDCTAFRVISSILVFVWYGVEEAGNILSCCCLKR